MEVELKSLRSTRSFAKNIAKEILKLNDISILLEGELGTGKTTLIRYLVEALGGNPQDVLSPSFTLLTKYDLPSAIPFYHIDLYRLDSMKDVEESGLLEILSNSGIKAIEWPHLIEGYLADAPKIKIHLYFKENLRYFTILKEF